MQSIQELLWSHPIQILDHTVVIENRQLRSWEAYSHKIVILFLTCVVWILFCFLCTDKCSSSRAMMPVGNVQTWHLGKLFCDCFDICLITDHPELMTESIDRSNEIVFGMGRSITHNKRIQHVIVRICKENRLNISIVHTNVLHTIFFLITTR